MSIDVVLFVVDATLAAVVVVVVAREAIKRVVARALERERAREREWEIGFVCQKCGVSMLRAIRYMVRDEVWQQAAPVRKGDLCVNCLASLLGRPLTIEDFTDVPLNDPIHFGFALAASKED